MKALVTGSTGFIGGNVCRGLTARGWEVHAFRRASSMVTLLNGLPVEQFVGDLTEPETILAAAKGVDVIFHTAAMMNGGSDLEAAKKVTVQGTRNVLDAAMKAGVKRVVHVSSVAALGIPRLPAGVSDPEVMDETHTWNELPEHWTYGYAKYLAEMEVQKAVAAGLDVVIVNPSVVLGAGDVYRASDSIIQTVSRGHLHVSVDGGLNLIHVGDVVDGILAAWQAGRSGERYILSNLNSTITSFLQAIARVTQVEPPRLILPAGLFAALRLIYPAVEHFINLPVDPELLNQAGRYFYYSNEKAKRELGWMPTRTIESAIQEAYHWFKLPLAIPEAKKTVEDTKQASV